MHDSTTNAHWVDDAGAALFTDLYQLTMLQAYFREGMDEEAVFDLFVRRLRHRNFLLACGLDTVLHYLETLRFTPEALDYLASLGLFGNDFLTYLADFRFTGDVYAVPEGTPVFAGEPLLEVVAPIGQAQLVETFLLNQITFQTGVASKAVRVVQAAAGRTVVDFGMRRMHGADAALKAARAYHIAGVQATSNVLAGHAYGLRVTGTMAHSYIEAHRDEGDAFRAFARLYPGTTLLVDTYDTLEGVRRVIRLAREQGEAFRVKAIRLDSGDLAALARAARRLLDEAGLHHVQIFASGSLDEYAIADLVAAGAPIDGFGVGTRMGTMADQPYLDSAYKLAGYAGKPRMKLSTDKANLPGRKQVYRLFERDTAVRDVIATAEEAHEGTPLLLCVMRGGRRTEAGRRTLDEARRHAERELARLPARLLTLDEAEPPYPVELSPTLQERAETVRRRLEARHVAAAG
ncbi:nicotinate phosphoribosyltransferase [Rhodocaloribacter litoris]|uniref:nicotinate phosphoribosyltransferase n=1 Tax=Rhodocaloribacter litoris TaxID=2558931 RepID=UPI001421EA78|nr:nicotinate phosphoribosyltransferase [Rhodocaloribacter litoris]QXD16618.1 nicotinate phosphoribosyltransferase [Rhodocaloribacter litoris]